MTPRRRLWRSLGLGYLGLLILSHGTSRWGGGSAAGTGVADAQNTFVARAVEGDERGPDEVVIAYREAGRATADSTATTATSHALLLLHGSPGDSGNFEDLGQSLARDYRLIAPDLPGFGDSTLDVPDYSLGAHADYLLQFLDGLEIDTVDVVAFSMGGGVAAILAERAPERVRSMVLLSAIGVQETELFGNHLLNHAVHGLQLAGVQALRWLVPHFGAFDGFTRALTYARNFYDSDQRPLREFLTRYRQPMLIVHGERDFLVPQETALEHHRIVPHSELHMLASSHFLLWTDVEHIAALIDGFVARVESGDALARSGATEERRARAAAPFDPADAPKFEGPALLLALLLLAAATLVSEDLTCIGAGLLVAQGRLGFVAATLACFVGIFIGDLMLYIAGRWLGRPALEKRPLRWFVKASSVEGATHWFEARGARVIFLSRFLPGLRLPTYVAAGILRMRPSLFAFYFLLAGLVWTPLLVGGSTLAGSRALGFLQSFERWALPAFLLFALSILSLERLVLPLFSNRGRRLLIGSWRRKRRFEFWPPIVFYVPVAIYIVWLALKHRSLSVVTAVNPGIPTGGFVGESKSEILEALAGSREFVARHRLLHASRPPGESLAEARAFMSDEGLDFPIVLKPDVGQRGSGVRILKSEESLRESIDHMAVDSILQEFVDGPEYGVFYLRAPGAQRGEIFSITEKRLPVLLGDGRQTLEQLILHDERAVCAAATYFRANAHRLQEVPADGRPIELVELGTHCRGAVFLDGDDLRTAEMEERFETMSRGFEGFFFGRYDVRARSAGDLQAGRGFKILELNGLTSEATHIYDPRHGLFEAYRTLFRQWRLAFEIGADNRAHGARVWSPLELFVAWRDYRKLEASHAPTAADRQPAAPPPATSEAR